MSKSKPAKISISHTIANSLTLYNNPVDKSTIAWYQSVMRKFIWLAMYVYPDLTYSVRVSNQFGKNFGIAHVELVKHHLVICIPDSRFEFNIWQRTKYVRWYS